MVNVSAWSVSVFPAHAGMSRKWLIPWWLICRFPRSRGDEPAQGYVQIVDEEFSPLTRG